MNDNTDFAPELTRNFDYLDGMSYAEDMEPIDLIEINAQSLSAFAPLIPAEFHPAVAGGELPALGAAINGTACGAMVFCIEDGAASLLSLYVAPNMRRQYIASTLLSELVAFLTGYNEYAVSVLKSRFVDDGSGGPEFLRYAGFSVEPAQGKTLLLDNATLRSCRFMSAPPVPDVSLISFSDLSAYEIRQLQDQMAACNAVFYPEPLTKESIAYDHSLAAYRGETPICCACLYKEAAKGEYTLKVFFTTDKTSCVPTYLLRALTEQLLSNCSEPVTVRIPIITESAEKLLFALVGGESSQCEQLYDAVLEL